MTDARFSQSIAWTPPELDRVAIESDDLNPNENWLVIPDAVRAN
jgi:hypothetical protein